MDPEGLRKGDASKGDLGARGAGDAELAESPVRGTTMSTLGTKGRRYFLLTTVLTVLLMGSLAVPAGAHPGHGGKHTDAPRVQDVFNGSPPPRHIECEWRHGRSGSNLNHYRCTGSNDYSPPLTRENHQGLLRSGGGSADYAVANPDRFTCDKVTMALPDVPSSWACEYRNEHHGYDVEFRLHEMVMMEDPAGRPGQHQIFYALPPA